MRRLAHIACVPAALLYAYAIRNTQYASHNLLPYAIRNTQYETSLTAARPSLSHAQYAIKYAIRNRPGLTDAQLSSSIRDTQYAIRNWPHRLPLKYAMGCLNTQITDTMRNPFGPALEIEPERQTEIRVHIL